MAKIKLCPYCLRPQVLVYIPQIGYRYKHRFKDDAKNCRKVNKRILDYQKKYTKEVKK